MEETARVRVRVVGRPGFPMPSWPAAPCPFIEAKAGPLCPKGVGLLLHVGVLFPNLIEMDLDSKSKSYLFPNWEKGEST